MKKIIAYLFPIILVIIFIVTLNSAMYLKDSLSNISQDLKVVENDIKTGNWQRALKSIKSVENTWKQKVVPSIQFDVAKNDIIDLSTNFVRLRGAIIAKDKVSALIEINEAQENWKSLGK
ncbi:DUF4363 family protein [Selenihalanaerobacter shriftii]|uniref:DUF4363 domain-containing protein n=1 Tax=Selenihalanaerobacter shriftii TaxID=142842 RepID=A0A1T4PUG1_9FIRM|nr:DUF4363 family protein [Selenihalanaerobacter shriftii]SJZ94887.1 protein of unknown function [Selenihalanaerobacter shriftii]